MREAGQVERLVRRRRADDAERGRVGDVGAPALASGGGEGEAVLGRDAERRRLGARVAEAEEEPWIESRPENPRGVDEGVRPVRHADVAILLDTAARDDRERAAVALADPRRVDLAVVDAAPDRAAQARAGRAVDVRRRRPV